MRARANVLDDLTQAREIYRDAIETALDAGLTLGEVRRWLLEGQNRARADVLADQETDLVTLAGPIVEQTEGPQRVTEPLDSELTTEEFEQLVGTRIHQALEAMNFQVPQPGEEVTVKIRTSGVQLSVGEDEGDPTESMTKVEDFPVAPWHQDQWGDIQ